MRAFRTNGGAGVRYSVAFTEHPFANISFFDRARTRILFHLSLRREKGIAAINTRDGQTWGGEEQLPLSFADAGDAVEIQLDPPHVSVLFNGETIFTKELPDLDRITFVNFGGGVEADSFAPFGPANEGRRGEGVLSLMPLLVLDGWAFDPESTDQKVELEIEGMGEPPQVVLYERSDLARRLGAPRPEIGIYAILPGRIWQTPGAADGLLAQIVVNGVPCGQPLAIKPNDALTRIEGMTADGIDSLSAFGALQAVEHIRFGGFFDQLSTHAQGVIVEAAQMYGVSAFMVPGDEGVAPDARPPEIGPIAPDIALMDRVRTAFLTATRADPHRDPARILADEIAFHLPPPAARKRLYLGLTEHFCAEGRFEDLATLASSHGDVDFGLTGSPWHDTMTLPYLYRAGDYDAVAEIITETAERASHAGSTVAMAWVAGQAARGAGGIAPEDTTAILSAWFSLIEAMAQRYWDRAHCAETARVTAEIVSNARHMPQGLRDAAARFALRVFGLSRQFWEALEGAQSGDIAVAQAAFQDLQSDPAGALRIFDRFGCLDTPRVRRELLGPAGVETGPDLARRLYQDTSDAPAAALRLLASPGQGEDAELAPLAHQGFLQAYAGTDLPQAPFYDLQIEVAEQLNRMLLGMESGSVPAQSELEPLMAGLETLSDARSRHIGIALGLTLLDGALWVQEPNLATQILARLGDWVSALSEEDLSKLRRAPAVGAALWALAQRYPAEENRFADAAQALVPRLSAMVPPTVPDTALTVPSRLFDTLVAVISCKPNLNTRVAAMREGWLSTLEAMGIPFVVVTGDGDGTLDGDVLGLDAPDDYEGLPQKTLRLIDWALEHTAASYILKIDDDCFLNPPAFFLSQSYKKFDYYGRRIVRQAGNMDRTWHAEKSRSARGKYELDKSPEPAVYCDGGSGYVLSRRAMQMVADAQTWPKNRQLLQSSFMEDKLVGDLLASGNIRPGDEDYYVAVQRRTHGPAIPVSLWANSFHPSHAAPVKLVHLDSDKPQKAVLAGLETNLLRPKKLWPSYKSPAMGLNTNALELVSDEAHLARVNAADLCVVAAMRNEMFMAPQFLGHYRKLGVESFLIADNCSDDGTLEYLASQPDVAVFSVDTDYGASTYGVAWQQAILSNLRVGRWSLVADADELLVYPGWQSQSLADHLKDPAYAEADAVRIFMLDMYPKGPMAEATFANGDPFAEATHVDRDPFLTNWPGRGPYSNARTWTSALRHRLIPGSFPALFVAQKIALLKYQPWMRVSAGLHYAADTRLSAREMIFAHFKYNAEFRKKALAETRRQQHFNNAEEYQRYLALASEGRDTIYDPEISVPWQESGFVRERMSG